MENIEKILVLVNPAASDNDGRHIWAGLKQHFDTLFSSYDCQVVATESREHSVRCGANAQADLIISVSGDGTLHDIAQGILQRPRAERPLLTAIPIGSGNDFAKTLGLPSDPRRALQAISDGSRASIDVGRCNGTIFLQTLSFGIDAAIALKTMEKRRESARRGFLLYASVAVSAILNDLRPHRFRISADGQPFTDDELLICAVQNGPSYGGGFQIAPSALVNDGLLNICTASNTSTPHALYAMSLIARGKHERLKIMRTLRARQLSIELDEPVPTQVDGELLTGTSFQIDILPQALEVIVTGQAAVQVQDQPQAQVPAPAAQPQSQPQAKVPPQSQSQAQVPAPAAQSQSQAQVPAPAAQSQPQPQPPAPAAQPQPQPQPQPQVPPA